MLIIWFWSLFIIFSSIDCAEDSNIPLAVQTQNWLNKLLSQTSLPFVTRDITPTLDPIQAVSPTVVNLFKIIANIVPNFSYSVELIYEGLSIIADAYREYKKEIGTVSSLDGDVFYLNASQLIKKSGFDVEEHTVTTEDGYILTMQRIPKENAPVVYLLHGILDSADTWLTNSPDPKKCLAFILSSAGYDVWLGNSRGNKYSTRHDTLNPNEAEFWKFSFDQQGEYDLPASIDYILNKTSQEQIHYIGHSQGSSTFFAMCALRPNYNDKIKVMIALAPVAWTTHIFSPLISAAVAFPMSLVGVPEALEAAGFYKVLAYNESIADISQIACSIDSPTQPLCSSLLFEFFGYDYDQMNLTRLPVYIAHTPAGASLRQLAHLCQEKFSGKFRRFDHGPTENLAIYGVETPPDYNVSEIRAPIALFYGRNDYCARLEDGMTIINNFPNIVYEYVVPFDKFNHVDFLWGLDANTMIYDEILKIFNSYRRRSSPPRGRKSTRISKTS